MSGPTKHSVRVSIVGEEYTLKSDVSPERTRELANYVDLAIRGVMQSASVVESHKAAILAALMITDELFKERAGNAEMAEAMGSLSSELRRWLPPGKRGEAV